MKYDSKTEVNKLNVCYGSFLEWILKLFSRKFSEMKIMLNFELA